MERTSVARTLLTGYPEAEARLVTYCGSCGGELFEKQEAHTYGDDSFCDSDCLMDHLIETGAVKVTVLEGADAG